MKKREKCVRKNIEFTFNGDTSITSFMKESDVYVLFGNLIDTAIEASDKIEDQDLRVISLNLYKDKEFVVVECHNYFDGELKTIDGALTTTKKNKGYHGLGIKSIKNICNAYGGTYFQEHNGQVFHTTITFNSVE